MKGFVKVDKSDLLSAIIGFELRLEDGKKIRDKGIKDFYGLNYNTSGALYKWLHRNTSPHEFAINHMDFCDNWSDVLHSVLSAEEIEELEWWCWTHKDKADPVKALYKAAMEDGVLVDQDMANFINKHKHYMESV
jgi:hypothetical protein